MKTITKEVITKDYVTKSNLPTSDYVINPYTGCTHGCKYCYASFMKRFTNHAEEWGTFIDIKRCKKPISKKKLENKTVVMSSVTDCYNSFEEKYKITRNILEQLINIDCKLNIITKSSLILRDLDILKKFKNLVVSISINTIDENFRKDMDNASSIQERLRALKELHSNSIYTVLFMSPIFPEITDFKTIIEISHNFVDEYWFENLNLRGAYKKVILDYVHNNYPQYDFIYESIYKKGLNKYWQNLALEIDKYCNEHSIKYTNYFYHEKLVKEKVEKKENFDLKAFSNKNN